MDECNAMSHPSCEVCDKVSEDNCVACVIETDLFLSFIEQLVNFPMIVEPPNKTGSKYINISHCIVLLEIISKD